MDFSCRHTPCAHFFLAAHNSVSHHPLFGIPFSIPNAHHWWFYRCLAFLSFGYRLHHRYIRIPSCASCVSCCTYLPVPASVPVPWERHGVLSLPWCRCPCPSVLSSDRCSMLQWFSKQSLLPYSPRPCHSGCHGTSLSSSIPWWEVRTVGTVRHCPG